MTIAGVSEFGFEAEHAAVEAGTLKAVLAAGVAPVQPAARVTVVSVLLATVPVMVTVVVLTVTVAPTYALAVMPRLVSVALVSV
jgi:hypothetical protein